MMRVIFVLLFIVLNQSALASDAIRDPYLVFDSSHLSALEECLINNIQNQSPDDLIDMIPGGSPGYVEDQDGNPIKTAVSMLIAGHTSSGGRVGYRVIFKTADGSEWRYVQSGQTFGVVAPNMAVDVQVENFRTGVLVFTADVASCR